MKEKQFECHGCGAQFEYDPGAEAMKCPFCGHEKHIPKSAEEIKELDFQEFLDRVDKEEETMEVLTIKCQSCGAESSSEPNETSSDCPFCGTNIVTAGKSTRLIKPKALLPFKVTKEEAFGAFRRWLKSLWFAPNKLKRDARKSEALTGIYIPFWTYDCSTSSYYSGQRGENYYVNEEYTADVNGKRVVRTRQIQKVRWYPVSGWVMNKYDDVLILASKSIPKKFADKLDPWGMPDMVTFEDGYLSGFRAQSYQVNLQEGFEEAKEIIDLKINNSARQDIGGDHQRIDSIKSQYDDITFKHLLLPIWISAYRFQNKVYQFLVNGRTSEVQAGRPYSWIKIMLTILGAAAAITAFIYLSG